MSETFKSSLAKMLLLKLKLLSGMGQMLLSDSVSAFEMPTVVPQGCCLDYRRPWGVVTKCQEFGCWLRGGVVQCSVSCKPGTVSVVLLPGGSNVAEILNSDRMSFI